MTYGYFINGKITNRTTGPDEHYAILGAENSQSGTILYEDERENNQIVAVVVAEATLDNPFIYANSTTDRTDIYGNITYTINSTQNPNGTFALGYYARLQSTMQMIITHILMNMIYLGLFLLLI